MEEIPPENRSNEASGELFHRTSPREKCPCKSRQKRSGKEPNQVDRPKELIVIGQGTVEVAQLDMFKENLLGEGKRRRLHHLETIAACHIQDNEAWQPENLCGQDSCEPIVREVQLCEIIYSGFNKRKSRFIRDKGNTNPAFEFTSTMDPQNEQFQSQFFTLKDHIVHRHEAPMNPEGFNQRFFVSLAVSPAWSPHVLRYTGCEGISSSSK
ncbi:hypothetical protein HPP92_010745 [Vanilla planifolia]|uniref:Uncharacterized protein n=1 Tax=Vanilla planifolia TaxID=51239 RepID=A0A835QZG9_VANPL|nr:hypothetical protein HPP92_010996 [Vanilla planifolia]KAG0482661.1 hypothetical protein HPP92_010745 [Vanilla planifolia]